MKNIYLSLITLSVIVGILALPASSPAIAAIDPQATSCSALADISGAGCASGESEVNSTIQSAVNILLYLVGAASVIGIIIGSIKFITAGGDNSGITAAKNTVLYSVIGLIVAVLAFAIITFVNDRL